MISRTIALASLLSFSSLLQGVHGEDMSKLKSMTSEQFKSPEWANEIQLSGTFRLGGKGFASLTTPRGNFWVEEGKSSSGYKLIELDLSKSQPSALIQKGDRQAWIGLRTGIVPRTREVRTGDLRMRGGLYYARGDKEPFNGKQITPRSDGSKWLEMPYVNGKRHGKKIWYEIDGRIGYETPYVDGRRQGVAITYYEDGSKKAETPWVKGNRNGTEIKYRRNGSKESETVYLNNNKQSGIWYREDGSKWKQYDIDQHNGVPTYYDENGIKKEEPPMVDGKLHGMVVGYHEDGTKSMETPYLKGKRQGVMIKYYEDGSKSSETPYVDGNANGTEIKYRRNGSKEMETVYVKHSKQSEVWYREDGSKWKEMPYKGHVLHGTAVSYQKDGSIKEETPWVNGKINGMQIGYREDGSKAMETLFENGKEISRKEF